MEIRDYIERAKRDPTREHLREMWRAIFTLKAWYFLPARPDEGPNRPLVLELDGEPWIAAFTNVRRYRELARRADRVDEDGDIHGLMLDPGEALRKIRAHADSVVGVVFNPGSQITVRAPVDAIVAYGRQFDVPGVSD